MSDVTRIAIIGCGFVADYYMQTLSMYPQLQLSGVYDKDVERIEVFSEFYGLKKYESLSAVLDDPSVEIILNLTNPRAHYEVTSQCLKAGKHVYSEKPLAMNFEEAEELTNLANTKNLKLLSAPCSVLGYAARNLEYAVKTEVIGRPLLVYAELDDGLVHKMKYQKWISKSGAPWPYRDEFEVGCTLEHAAYYISWLVKIFGNISEIAGFSDCLIKDKLSNEPVLNPHDTPDMSIGIIQFSNGVVVRLTTTIIAPHDHSIKIIGENGIISMKECWDNHSKVYIQKLVSVRRRTFLNPIKTKVRMTGGTQGFKMKSGNTGMDFILGVENMARQLREDKPSFFDNLFCLHVTEASIAIQNLGSSSTYHMKSNIN